MTVTVAVPYFDCPDEVERAVRSILAQTHKDLVCVVIGDGQEPPLNIEDDRLVIYVLPKNRGAYFAEELVIEANPHPWYAPMGADDYVEPDHLETLLALGHSANAPARVCLHSLDGELVEKDMLWEVGVFATDRIRAIGGHNPSERDQDMLLMRLLHWTGGVTRTPKITYHHVKRSGSLTMNPLTGKRSSYRRGARRRANHIVARARGMNWEVDQIRAYRKALVPDSIRRELEGHAEQLRALL